MSSVGSQNAARQDERTPAGDVCAPGGQPTVVRRERVAASLPESPRGTAPELLRRLFPGPNDPDVDPAGVKLGHFTIEARIGRGGMGAVFRARDERLKRTVALKLLAPEQSRDQAAVARFLNEAQAAARLNHENIARVFYSGEDHGLQFIAFEFVEGVNLLQLLQQRGVLQPAEAIVYTLQVAHALAHASAYGVVHRDIKPSNIIVTPEGSAKLVDLGLARKQSWDTTEAELTVAGTTLGTFDYLAPEQAQDPRNVDVRSDIYSLGCTLYHLLTGSPPYPEGTLLQKVLAHREGTPPDVRARNPQVTPELAAVVRKMMANRPEDRYQTAEELIVDLERVARQYGVATVSGPAVFAPRAFRSRLRAHLGWLIAGAVVLVAAIAAEWAGTSSLLHVASPEEPLRPIQVGPGRGLPDTTPPAARRGTPQDVTGGVGVAESASGAGMQTAGGTDIVSTAGHDLTAGALQNTPQEAATGSAATGPADAETTPVARGEANDVPPAATADREGDADSERPVGAAGAATAVAEQTGSGTHAAGTAESNGSRPPASPSQEARVYRVLPAGGSEAQDFRTLEAALTAVPDGGVIECRFDGVRKETPAVLHGKNVVIRGAMGFHPVLQFEPAQRADWSREMLRLNGGSLSVVGLHVRLRVERGDTGGDYCLFAVNTAKGLRLRDTVVTLDGGSTATAAVRITHEPLARRPDMKMMTKPADAPMVPEVELSDVVVRGDGHMAVVAQTTPLRLIVSGSLIATTGDVVRVVGAFAPPAENAVIETRFDHSTFATGGSLLAFDAGGVERTLPQMLATVRSCVVAAATDQPMVAMQGTEDTEQLRSLLRWSGERNVYDGVQVFWRFGKSASEQVTDFREWVAFWGAYEVGGQAVPLRWPVDWRRVARWSELTPDAFVLGLENGVASSAIGAAAPMAGADAARLQELFEVPQSGSESRDAR